MVAVWRDNMPRYLSADAIGFEKRPVFRERSSRTNVSYEPDSYHAIIPVRVDICLPIVSVEEKHSQHKTFNFSFLSFNTIRE